MLTALLLRIHYAHIVRDDLFSKILIIDAKFYDQWALEITGGDWLGKTIFHQDPLYAYFLALCYKIFGHDYTSVRFVQAVLDTGTVAFIYVLGNAIAPGVGMVAAALAAFYAPMIYYVGLLDKTTLTLFLISMSLALFSVALKRQNRWLFAATGITLGLSVLTRGNFLLVGIALGLWLSISSDYQTFRDNLLSAGTLLIGLSAIIGIVSLRNYAVGREFVLVTTNVGLNFAIGNNPSGSGGYVEPPFIRGIPEHEFSDSKAFAESQLGKRIPRDSEVSSFFIGQGIRFITQKPWQWLRLMGKKIFLFLNSLEISETYSFNYFKALHPGILGLTISFGLLAPLGICGLLAVSKNPNARWLLVTGAIYALSVIVFFVTSRYRIPIILILIPTAAYYIIEVRKSDLPKVLDLVWPLIPIGLLCNWQPQWLENRLAKSDRATPHSLIGNILYQNGQHHEAIREFEIAKSLLPEDGMNYLYLSQCYDRLGQQDKVIESLEGAIRVNPMLDQAYANLAVVLADKGDYNRAFRTLSQAMRLKPYDPVYRDNYAKLTALMHRNAKKR